MRFFDSIQDSWELLKKSRSLQRFAWRVGICAFVITYLSWNYIIKRPLYQMMYGKPSSEHLEIYDADQIIEIPDQPVQRVTANGFDIDVQLIKRFSTTTRIVYIDRYSSLGTWYRSSDGSDLYDKVVPLDISIATGEAGRHPECYKFSHEYRCLWTESLCSNTESQQKHINNNHLMVTSENIQKGLEILRVGDIAYLEGYLVYWQGTGKYSYYRFESSIQLGQLTKDLYGGSKGQLCRQLYLTKLTFDGYTFE